MRGQSLQCDQQETCEGQKIIVEVFSAKQFDSKHQQLSQTVRLGRCIAKDHAPFLRQHGLIRLPSL